MKRWLALAGAAVVGLGALLWGAPPPAAGPKLHRRLSASRAMSRGSRPAPVASPEVLRGDVPALDPEAARRVGGMTLERALEDLGRYGEGGVMPNHARWLYQVTGLLALDPESPARFAEVALARGLQTQTLALDVLSQVDSDEGQAAAVEVLERTEWKDTAAYERMVQSLVLVRAPTEDTIEAVLEIADRRGPGQLGATNVLGSLAAAVRAEGGDERRLIERLGRGVRAPEPEVRAAHVLALGNASAPGAVGVIEASADDPVAEVRRAAARALRHYEPSPTTIDALSALGRDVDPFVNAAAVDALVSMGDARSRSALLELPAWEPRSVERLVAGLEAQGASAVELLPLVERLLDREGLTPQLRERLRRLRMYGQPS